MVIIIVDLFPLCSMCFCLCLCVFLSIKSNWLDVSATCCHYLIIKVEALQIFVSFDAWYVAKSW